MNDAFMSERAKNHSMLILGICTFLMTVGIQVIKVGELKGSISTVIKEHETQLKDHGSQIKALDHSVSRIEGHLGINADAARAKAQNVAGSQPSTSGPYSTP